ncbi:MAG TPA: prolyl oligopeptidase family serine peptidase [Steroidobacteraceae bacterium]
MRPLDVLIAVVCALLQAAAAAAAPQDLALEKIMADPAWVGPRAKDGYWSGDGRSVYYSLQRAASPIVDLHRIDLKDRKDQTVEPQALAAADGPPVFDAAGKRAAFVRSGDIFVRDLASGRLTQITRSAQLKAAPQFSADGGLLSFRVGNDWFVHDFGSGVTAQAAVVKTEKDPDAAPKPDDLRDMQLRTFSTLKKLHDEADALKKHAAELRSGDATQAAAAFYIGDDLTIRDTELSPDAHWLAIVAEPKSAAKGFEGKLTRYVTESGYEEFETERTRVGRNIPASHSLLLLNLVDHTVHTLAFDTLPGIADDPLQAIRAENGTQKAAGAADSGKDKPQLRAVSLFSDDPENSGGGVVWSSDGKALAVELLSVDNKDRWIASVDFSRYALIPQHRLSDPAWVNWDFNEFGWLKDNRTLWFESEQSGYAHLYTKAPNAAARALTQGQFEVSAPTLSADGRWFYVLANAVAPYSYDVYRVASGGGELQRITHLQGLEKFTLDASGKRLLLTHSSPYIPAQLAIQNADGSGVASELTDTRPAAYKSLSWIEPQIIKIPSSHIDGTIYAKLYRDAPAAGAMAAHAGVIFIHGAGYTQNVSLKFPYYFREQMFNNWLVQHGYIVLDLDYRASAGYGRDWRTAIYRQMGHPELEDLLDAKRWLVQQAAVDAKRIGLYGGSYGGFMTLMALFRAPGEFAAGAALRPVTDWMQYEQGYTSSILNDPQSDPIAYKRSSPLEFADGLRDPLLICHGVIDDNVLFEDSMRLYERLIELHKDNFTISPYPLDRHGFTNADSWLDEYKRIYRLFEANLKTSAPRQQ